MGLRHMICGKRRRMHLRNYLCAFLFLATIYIIIQGTSLGAIFNSNKPVKAKVHQKGTGQKIKTKSSHVILGVRTDDLLHYVPDGDGMFHCLDGSDKIQMSQVNDDYCDCPSDGSDEPGTDACPNSRFYCEFEDKFLPSGKINDGICDCCDGSDEWKSELGAVKVKGFPFSDVLRHAPCIDLCSKISDRQIEEKRVREVGQRIKQQYIDRAKGHVTSDVYGKDGEFYPLSKECYDYADFTAVYKVCLWHKVEQTQKGHMFKVGRKGHWGKDHKDGRQVLVMDDGDKRGCPGSPRKAEILFRCGVTNTIANLREEDRCVYIIDFITPAAC